MDQEAGLGITMNRSLLSRIAWAATGIAVLVLAACGGG
jgi:hypothetical protein